MIVPKEVPLTEDRGGWSTIGGKYPLWRSRIDEEMWSFANSSPVRCVYQWNKLILGQMSAGIRFKNFPDGLPCVTPERQTTRPPNRVITGHPLSETPANGL